MHNGAVNIFCVPTPDLNAGGPLATFAAGKTVVEDDAFTIVEDDSDKIVSTP